MAQKRIAINNWNTVQPTAFEFGFETTATEDSGRAMSGGLSYTPLFTVEAYDVEYQNLKPAQASTLLQHIIPTPSKPYFSLYYFSPYFNAWRTAQFYVGDGTRRVQTLVENGEVIENITCRFVGRNKLC